MNNWLGMFERLLTSDPCEGREMKLGGPASAARMEEVERQFGFAFPDEFRSLYGTYDGYGVVFDNKPAEIFWDFRPLGELVSFANGYRDTMAEAHPSLATRFFPFFDWSTGDSAGYLLDNNSKLLPGLYDFHHAAYEGDPNQNVSEFLVLASDSIAGYLENIIAECENA